MKPSSRSPIISSFLRDFRKQLEYRRPRMCAIFYGGRDPGSVETPLINSHPDNTMGGSGPTLHVGQHFIQTIDEEVGVGFGDAHRWFDTQYVAVQAALQ